MPGYITSIGTAKPVYSFPQGSIADFMSKSAGLDQDERRRLQVLYRASGIKSRSSVIPDFGRPFGEYEFFPNAPFLKPEPNVSQRLQLFRKYGPELAAEAIISCLENHSNKDLSDITHLITVSCTGMYAPGLDIDIIRRLEMSTSTKRTNIAFMGCYAAFNGLNVAGSICQADPEAVVLVVCVELCTIHYRTGKDTDTLLANALFGDGAAAALIQGHSDGQNALQMTSSYSEMLSEGIEEMTWEISPLSFEMKLSSYVPDLIKKGIGKLTAILLNKGSVRLSDIAYFAIHPGGKRILEVLEEELEMETSDNRFAYKVLREYGNMSSATIVYVLKELLNELIPGDQGKNVLSLAFGPGLTIESMLLKTVLAEPSVTTTQKTYAAIQGKI
ncbi:MAG: type III polyketide synthase [Cytophagaceae bacterium]